jgi:hypothetical protein
VLASSGGFCSGGQARGATASSLEHVGKFTEWLTVFALKGGNLHSRMEINWFESRNMAAFSGSRHSIFVNSRQMVRLMFASFELKEVE